MNQYRSNSTRDLRYGLNNSKLDNSSLYEIKNDEYVSNKLGSILKKDDVKLP